MHDDIKWFFGLIIVVGILWWTGRGMLQNPAQNTDTSNQPSSSAQTPLTAPEQLKAAEKKVVELQNELKQKQEEENYSPLRGKIVIGSLSRNTANPKYEYISIRASSENTSPIKITGLTIKSLGTGNEAQIPGAWDLPFANMSGEGPDVSLAPGETAYIISGNSPINISFKDNICTGYFAYNNSFYPPISISCPYPINEPLPTPPNQLSDECLNFISGISSCTTPAIPQRLSNDGSCQAHITKNINYESCVRIHKNERGFFKGVWYLYLKRTSGFWKEKRETAELYDQNNKPIDSRDY